MAPCPVPTVTTQIVKASSTPVLPVAVFMDSVAHSPTDSVLGVWAINMISQKRHVVALVRKTHLCRCGWGLVFPVPADETASLIPRGHGGWEVCVEGNSTFPANVVRKRLLGNQCCEWGFDSTV